MKKQTISYKEIMGLVPCYDPKKIGIPENYEASIVDFIEEYKDKVKQKNDILWVVAREEYLNDKELRLFAVWCARQVQHLMKDKRSIKALDVAEKHANGEASKADLREAKSAAIYAAYAATAAAAAANHNAADASDAVARAAVAAVARAAAYAARTATRTANAAQIDRLLEIFKSRL